MDILAGCETGMQGMHSVSIVHVNKLHTKAVLLVGIVLIYYGRV